MKSDLLLTEISRYVATTRIARHQAYDVARWCLLDSLGCAMLALQFPACAKLLGPVVPGAVLKRGARVPGTKHELDPVKAAFDIGTLIRWLDYNDTWLAAEWGHPSDNLGAILACADYVSRSGKRKLTMRDVLTTMIKAHEIQGVLALKHAFNRVGLDHVLLVRIASTAVATQLLGGTREQITNALSHAWIDGGALRTYRHKPNTGSRKSWAAGDATSRAVRLALIALTGEMGYATALTAKQWGFCDVLFRGKPICLTQPLGSYVMEHVLFKVFPAEYHAQTAVEAALQLHPAVRGRLDEISRVVIETHESAIRIIDKTGPLRNPADRDHCLQYMAAVALIHGKLTADHYEDKAAHDGRIDALRKKMIVRECPRYSLDYLDPRKRSVANSLQVFFRNSENTGRIEVEYPLGHPRRRKEMLPALREKCAANLASRLSPARTQAILDLIDNGRKLETMSVTQFLNLFCEGR